MPTKTLLTTCLLLPLFGGGDVARSSERPEPGSWTLATFSESSLLRRFDHNQDGQFDSAERTKLRQAFGGIDVPSLPTKSLRYTLGKGPHPDVLTRLLELDNTPADNPLTDQGALLGRVLFYDKMLSRNNTIACASCHLQERAFADPRRLSEGFNGGTTGRNAMALANLRFTTVFGSRPGFFWDERAASLEDQVLMPIQDHVEMGMNLHDLENKLQRLPYYPPLFEAAFRSKHVSAQRIAQAVAQFMRSLVSCDSKFDRAAQANGGNDYSQDFADLTAAENLGKSLFIEGVGNIAEIGCAHCHVPPSFGMPKSLNNGLDLVYKDQGLGARKVASNDPFTANNDGKFKASSLRNIALTAPYMHDGRFNTLEQVLEHYSTGVHPHVNLSLAFNTEGNAPKQQTSGFSLTRKQKSALVAFLKTLTDETFISDPKFSDPFIRLKDGS